MSSADRRENARRPRRIPVKFWKRGDETAHTGFTTNISTSGAFISTRNLVPKGARLRIEFCDSRAGFMAEAEVARAIRTEPALQQVMPTGLGVRFLGVEELVAELFPSVPSQLRTNVVGDVELEEEPPAEQVADETADDSSKEDPPKLHEFVVRFPSDASYRQAYERDVRQGGLFVASQHPAPLDRKVLLEIHAPGRNRPFQLRAKVVQSVPPTSSDGGKPNLLAGMGVEFLDPQKALDLFRDHLS